MIGRLIRSGDSDRPVFVLASGQRCGSTLVQRVLMSHPRLYMWGEQGGTLERVREMANAYTVWDRTQGQAARESFRAHGAQAFVANMCPPEDRFTVAGAAFLKALFDPRAAGSSKRRWGFKEVRHGRWFAEFLVRLFPEGRVIHLTRDPRRVAVSLDAWERSGGWWRREQTARTLQLWNDINRSIADDESPAGWLRSYRYEDIVAHPVEFVREMSGFLDLPRAGFDAGVFDIKIPGRRARVDLRPYAELPADLRSLVETPAIVATARDFGYDIPGEQAGS